MPISDSKKVATTINHLGDAAFLIREQVARMKAMVVKFQAANPSVVDTPLQGNDAALFAAVTALDAQISKPIWDTAINAVVKSHRGEAL